MKNKVLFTSHFGTRLWIGTDHRYCEISVQGIHQGRVVSGRCRDPKDSIELRHIGLDSDLIRMARTGQPYSRGFGSQVQLYPIDELTAARLLAEDQRLADIMATVQAAAATC